MCGKHGKKCNGKRWIEFMGKPTSEDGYAPFKINYIFTNWTFSNIGTLFEPLSPKPVRCDEAPPGGEADQICPCQYCSTCIANKGNQLLGEVLPYLSSNGNGQSKVKPAASEGNLFSFYALSTCTTFGVLLYVVIVGLVLLYFCAFNIHDKSSYDGEMVYYLQICLKLTPPPLPLQCHLRLIIRRNKR